MPRVDLAMPICKTSRSCHARLSVCPSVFTQTCLSVLKNRAETFPKVFFLLQVVYKSVLLQVVYKSDNREKLKTWKEVTFGKPKFVYPLI